MSDPLAITPSEDRGRDTASWYRFQYAVSVLECLLVLRDGYGGVVVEWHTDFIRRRSGGEPDVLVSVKHRSLDSGPWSLADLASQALKTLYQRWRSLGATDDCAIITNGGLKTGELEARKLSDAIQNGEELNQFGEKLAPRLSCSVGEAVEFLSRLSIRSTGADESAITGHVIEQYCRPVLLELGLSPSQAHAVFDKLFHAIYDAASGCSDDEPNSWTSWVAWPEQQLRERTLDYRRLSEILASVGLVIDEIARGARASGMPPDTVMLRKLRRGGLGPSVESGAPRLRAQWYAIESMYRDDIPSGSADEVHRVRKYVLAKAMLAESEVRGEGPWGAAMHVALASEFAANALRTNLPIDDIDLLGCAYQLTDECHVWWSEKFDPLEVASSEAGDLG